MRTFGHSRARYQRYRNENRATTNEMPKAKHKVEEMKFVTEVQNYACVTQTGQPSNSLTLNASAKLEAEHNIFRKFNTDRNLYRAARPAFRNLTISVFCNNSPCHLMTPQSPSTCRLALCRLLLNVRAAKSRLSPCDHYELYLDTKIRKRRARPSSEVINNEGRSIKLFGLLRLFQQEVPNHNT